MINKPYIYHNIQKTREKEKKHLPSAPTTCLTLFGPVYVCGVPRPVVWACFCRVLMGGGGRHVLMSDGGGCVLIGGGGGCVLTGCVTVSPCY